jgi:hypothetical protein
VGEQTPQQIAEPGLTHDEQVFAIKTWRYLRLAMVVLVVGLAVSVIYERITVDGDCFQTSISAYYYTSVHAYFIGALVSIGVCLFCLKGSTDLEDVLLNLAGMFAPLVAFVPTPDAGHCGVVPGTTEHIHDNVTNNMVALFVVGGVALVILLALSSKVLPSRVSQVGYGVAAAVWLGGLLVFLISGDGDFFVSNVHDVAAGLMFLCIFLVVCINTREYKDKGPATSVRNRYGFIAVAMGISVGLFLIATAVHWDYRVLGIEVALISLFAAFWVIQTKDLWHEGLR